MPKSLDRLFFPLLCLFLAIFLICLNLTLFKELLLNDIMPGWDGAAHLAIGKVYAERIFPDIWGWINDWYLGMPFPQFYPPLFYFLIALLAKIFFFISYDIVFRLFVFFSLVFTPCLIAFLGYRLSRKKLTAILSGIIAVILLSFAGPDLNIGVGVGGTINTGLLSHSLAFNFFVLWLINFFQPTPWNKRQYICGVLFLTALFLTNVHLVVPALVFFISRYAFDVFSDLAHQHWKQFISKTFAVYLPYGLLALGLAAFWLLPMLSRYNYFLTTAFNIDSDIVLYYFLVLCYLPFFIISIFLTRRAIGIVLLTASISALAVVICLNLVIQINLPLPAHIIRWISPILYLSAIPTADVLTFLYEQCRGLKHKIIWFIFISIFLAGSSLYSLFDARNLDGIYEYAKSNGLFDVVAYLKQEQTYNPQNLTLVEANTDYNKPMSFALDSMLGQNGIPTVFSNIRESSMTGLYLTPLRNLFSHNPESWGIQSMLSFNQDFLTTTTPKARQSMASYFGVSTIVASSASTTYMLEKQLKLTKVFATSAFSVFHIPQGPEAIMVTQPLTAVFSDIALKNREWNTLSFSRLSEEWQSHFDPDVVFVRPQTLLIDNNQVFSFTKIAILDSYLYKDRTQALATLERFVRRGGKLFFLRNPKNDDTFMDNLQNILSTEDRKNVGSIATSTQLVAYVYNTIRKNTHELMLNDKKTLVSTSTADFSLKVKDRDMNIDLDPQIYSSDYLQNHPTPLLIKRSYFPDWVSKNGDVYLASPAFILYVPHGNQV
jgi:hypothetical protein